MQQPARALPPKVYIPVTILVMALAALPIATFVKTAFGARGSTLQAGMNAPPPMIAAAVTRLRARIARDAGDTTAYLQLAALEVQAGRTAAAREILDTGLRARPRAVDLLLARAEVLGAVDPAASLADLNRALAVDPRNPDAAYARAVAEQRAGRTADAARDFATFDRYARPDNPLRAERSGASGAR